jgi:hypothetical protein
MVCSGGKARGAEEQKKAWSLAERRKGGHLWPCTLSLKPCDAVVVDETVVGTAAMKLWAWQSSGSRSLKAIGVVGRHCSYREADERAARF